MKLKFIVILVSFTAFLGPFTQSVYVPLIPEVIRHFQTSPFLVNLTISIFTLFIAFMQLVYGPLADHKGRRIVILFGVSLYVLGSLGCFFSRTIYVLLFFRALQAIGIAAGSVVGVTVISDLFEGEKRGKAMGSFQTMVTLGTVLGPVVGGFLGGIFDFHSVFLVLVMAGLMIWLCNFTFLKETKPNAGTDQRFQIRDFAVILKNRIGSAVILLGFIQFYAYYNFMVFLPGIFSDRYGLTAEQKGLAFLPMCLSMMIGSSIGGRIQERIGKRLLVVSATFLHVPVIFFFLWVSQLSLPMLIIATMLFGLFLGLSLPVQTTLLTQAFQTHRATAVGVYNLFRFLGMAVGPMLGSVLFELGGYGALYGFLDAVFFGTAFVLSMLLFGAEKGFGKPIRKTVGK